MVIGEHEMLLHGMTERRREGFHWPIIPDYSLGYSVEEELLDQIGKLPKADDVRYLISVLRTVTLRELAVEVINGGIKFAMYGERLEYLRLINSWIATAEETIAAGRKLKRIVARRKQVGVMNRK